MVMNPHPVTPNAPSLQSCICLGKQQRKTDKDSGKEVHDTVAVCFCRTEYDTGALAPTFVFYRTY